MHYKLGTTSFVLLVAIVLLAVAGCGDKPATRPTPAELAAMKPTLDERNNGPQGASRDQRAAPDAQGAAQNAPAVQDDQNDKNGG